MKIFSDRLKVPDLKSLQEILTAHDTDWRHKTMLKNYYVGNHKVLRIIWDLLKKPA